MTIRPAIPGDLEAILRLAAATPEAPRWSRTTYESYLAQTHPEKQLFLVEESGNLTGFIAGQIIAGVCELQSIAVVLPYRRSGVGTSLLTALTVWAAGHGAAKVELEVRSGNHSAISFYERHKFQKDGLRPAYYHDPEEDALLMSLPLKPRNPATSSFPPQIG
ncbi:MAG: ribosomal protein S18-alanine N-acetyltransferase [Acidobacteriaceae bacterium]